MKITMLSSLPPIKGMSKYTAGLVGGMPESQEIEFLNFKQMYPERLYPGGTRDDSLQPIDLVNVRVRTFLTWYNPFGWIYAGLTSKGDVIHAQWWTYVLAPVYLTILGIAKLRGKRIILTIHNVKPHEQGLIKNLADNLVYRLGDHFIVHTKNNKETFLKNHNVSARKISVIPMGILLPDAPLTGISKTKAREKLGLANKAKIILFFGIIREYKGLDTLIEALALIREKEKDAQLVIAGKPWESWDKYEGLIQDNNLGSVVHEHLEFVPEQDIEAYFAAADVVALPYRYFDAQSAAGSLALPFGKAMVVTNVGGLPDLVKDNQVVCPPDDSVALGNALTLVLKDSDWRAKLKQDSLMIAQQLSWVTIAQKTLKTYRKL